ncbi:MAG TPA: M56 family metallopeptidase, partial [Gemmataceae bacterium]|nr:M56 family metallopeptidase [Gemmataceae bacterium]
MELLLDIGCTNALLATALASLAALSGWLWRRPALTHALWLLVLLKLVTPPFWPVAIPFPTGFESDSALTTITPAKNEQEFDSASTMREENSESVSENPVDSSAATGGYFAQEKMQGEGEGIATDLNNPVNEAGAFFSINWRPILFSVWLTGALAWFALAGWRLFCFRKLLRFAGPAPIELQDQVKRYANQLGLSRSPGAWMVPGAVSPMLWALIGRPRLLLPTDLWERMNDNQRATLLVHELAHLCRRDHWVRLLELLAAGLFWWHPVLWLAKHQLRQAEEECCDAWVVWVLPQFARDYALALMETVDFLSEVRLALPPVVSGIGHVHLLKRRLAMIMLGTTSKTLSRAGFIALVGLGALVLPLMPTWAQPSPNPQETGGKKLASEQPSPPVDISAPSATPARTSDLGVTGSYTVAQVTPPKVSSAIAAGTVEEAKDEIELLQAQLEVKMAETREGEARYEQAHKRLARLKSLFDKGALSQEEFAKAEDEAALMRAQLEPKQAQINEAKVRLNQARRRLARLTDNTPKGPTPSGSSGTSIGLPGPRGPATSSSSGPSIGVSGP